MTKFNLKFLFCSILLFCIPAVSSFADYGGGTGSAEAPFLIYTAEQFNQIGLNTSDWDKHFVLMADIDMIDINLYNIIGDYPSTPFTGVFDGRGHVIYTFAYTITGSEVGLFSYISGSGAQLKNLGLIEPFIDAGFSASLFVGVLEDGKITNCWVDYGYLFGHSTVGGLVSENYGGTISDCYVKGYIDAFDSTAGGIAALNAGTIERCYFVGAVSSNFNHAGAIAGEDDGGTYIACFWDQTEAEDINGIGNISPDPAGVVGETTANMQTASTFINSGWALTSPDNILEVYDWRTCEDGLDYPRLAIELYRGDFDCPDGVDEIDLTIFAGQWLFTKLEVNADFDSDTHVDLHDFAVLAAAWGSSEGSADYNPDVDIEQDGDINELDLALFVEYWLADGLFNLTADIEPYGGDGFVDWYDFARLADDWLKAY